MKSGFYLAVLLLLGTGVEAQSLQTLPLTSAREREAYRHMVTRLEGTVLSVEWAGLPLKEAIREIARQTGLNMVISAALRDREEEPVTLTLNDVRAASLLRILEDSYKLAFQQRHEVIHVTTPEAWVTRQLWQ